MGKYLTIALLLIVALLGLGFGWVTYQDKKALEEREASHSARLEQLEEQTSRLERLSTDAQAAEQRASQRAAQAEEAARMAEAQAAQAAAERQARVAELNQQLQRAAEDRRQAEAQAKQLAERMDALEAARAEAAQRLRELEAARAAAPAGTVGATGTAAESSELSQRLTQQESELAQLRAENEKLTERTATLLARQVAAEEAIVAAGGDFDLPVHEIMSPNAKRYLALRHRALVSDGGSGN